MRTGITQHNAKEGVLNMALLKAQFTEDVFHRRCFITTGIFSRDWGAAKYCAQIG